MGRGFIDPRIIRSRPGSKQAMTKSIWESGHETIS